jgi:hypothetical protein
MSDEMKLIMALCDAMGFDVEETKTFDSDDVIKWSNRWKTLEGLGVSFVPPDRPTPTVKYKITRRDKTVRDWSVTGNDLIDSLDVLYDGVALRQLVKNINELPDLAKKYRWIKYPRDSYNAVFEYFNGRMIVWSCANSFDVLGVKVMLDE